MTRGQQDDSAPLPGVLAEIAEAAGREAALDLAAARGGLPLHVPMERNLDCEHPLIAAVGVIAAQAIADRFEGETIYVPMARRAVARRLAGQGLSRKAIADHLGVSRRSVHRYLR